MTADIIDIKQKEEELKRKERMLEDEIEKQFFEASSNIGIYDQTYGASGVWSREIDAIATMQTVKGWYFQDDWVFSVVDVKASAISNSPLIVKEVSLDENGEEIIQPVMDHPLTLWFEQPNSYQDYSSWMYNISLEYNLLGNAIIWQSSLNKDLIVIAGDRVSLDFAKSGFLHSYNVTLSNEDERLANSMTFEKIPADEVLHIKRPHPNNMYWGFSPFIPSTHPIMFNRYSSDYINEFFRKGANPGAVITMEQNANPETMIKVQRSFEQAYTGRRNQRKPIVLPKGYNMSEFSTKVSDTSFIDVNKLNNEKIMRILRIPKHVLGLQESGSLGSEEYKTALRWFYENSVIPEQKKIAGSFTKQFEGMLAENQFIDFDNSDVSILQMSEQEILNIVQGYKGILTPNEIRAKYFSMPPHPQGDNLKESSFSEVQLPVIEEESEEKPDIVEPELLEENEEEKALERYREGCQFVDSIESKFDRWADAEKQAISSIERQGQSEMYKLAMDLQLGFLIKGTEVFKKNSVEKAAEIPSRKKLKEEIDKEFAKFEKEWRENYRLILEPTVSLGYDVQLSGIFNAEATDAINALRQQTMSKANAMLSTFGVDSFKSIKKTASRNIMREIANGVSKNKTIPEIIDALVTKFRDVSPAKAETIARTETLSALSLGKAAMMEDAQDIFEEAGEDLVKVWINAGDDRVRGNPNGKYPNSKSDHWHLQGETKPVDKNFSNGLRYPRDRFQGEASDVINCRCNFLVVPKEDLDKLNIPKTPKK